MWSPPPTPAWEKHKHPATRAFQAIRIAMSTMSLADLEKLLRDKALELLVTGGSPGRDQLSTPWRIGSLSSFMRNRG